MKRLLFLLFALQSLSFFSQQSPAPYINYQGVARQQDGTPITGLVGVEIIIKQGSLAGTASLTERYTVQTNTFGIFNLKIGTDKPGDFAAIDWANGPYFLIVNIDIQGGNNYTLASEQQLVSVPYAMYAKEAKNARVYVAGNNVTINNPSIGNTYTINAQGGSSGGVDTIAVVPSNHTVNSNGYKHTITIASPIIGSSSDIISVSNSFPNYNLSYKNPSLTITSGSVLTIQQGTYTSPPVTLPSNASVAVWTLNLGNIVQSNTTALVGIGLTNPTSKLDITGNTANIINATTTGSGNVINATTSGNAIGVNVIAGGNSAISIQNNSGTASAFVASNAGGASVIYAAKSGVQTGAVAILENTNSANTNEVVRISNSGNNAALNINSTTTSTLGLTLNGGHIKSLGIAPNVVSYTLTGGVSSVNYTTTGCTDVKGSILAVATTTGLINSGGQIGITVNFNKAYAVAPTVVITPTSDFKGMSYYISAVNQNFFQVYLKNNTPGNILGSSLSFNFNYFVIE